MNSSADVGKAQQPAYWTDVVIQGRRMYAQPLAEMIRPPASYIAGGRSLFSLCCGPLFGVFASQQSASGGSFDVNMNSVDRPLGRGSKSAMLLPNRALAVGVFLHTRCSLVRPTTRVSIQKPTEALARADEQWC